MRALSYLKSLAAVSLLALTATAAQAEIITASLTNASVRADGPLSYLNYSNYTGTLQVNIDNGGGLLSNGDESSLTLARGLSSQTFYTNSGSPHLIDGNVVGTFVFSAPNTLSAGSLTFALDNGDDLVVNFAGRAGALYLESGPFGERLALATTVTGVSFPTNFGGFDLSGLGGLVNGIVQELKINALTANGVLTDSNADTFVALQFGVAATPNAVVVPVPAAMPAGALLLVGLGVAHTLRRRRSVEA